MDSITVPSCGRTPDPDMPLYNNSVQDAIIAPGHSDLYGTGGSMALRHQQGHRRLTRSWTSTEPSVVREAMDINPDSC